MTINFALSLSFEGIELLHRVQSGWRRLGSVQINSSTLDADLTELRQKAIALAPDGFTTKLIIPRDQIKYTAIDGTRTTDDDIHAALDGATPYALDELVIDCERFGGRTHIAAVARETLAEAEGFAAAHGFNPVAFVAIPEPFTFQKEVFFGPTEAMPSLLGATATVEGDTLPVLIAGTRLKSRLLVMDDHPEPDDDIAEFLQSVAENEVAAKTDDVAAEAVTVEDVPTDVVVVAEPDDAPTLFDDTSVEDAPNLVLEEPPVAAPPAPERIRQAIWTDRVPAEVYPEPAPPEVAAAPLVVAPFTPVFATLPLFDRIIPEVRNDAPARPKAAATGRRRRGVARAPRRYPPAAAAPIVPVAPVAPVRQPAPAPKPVAGKAILIAATIAIVVIGGVIWAKFAGGQSAPAQAVEIVETAPVVTATAPVATPAQPVLEAGPDIPSLDTAGFGPIADQATPPPALTASTAPVQRQAPQIIAVAPQSVAPAIPQTPAAPPPPPDENVANAVQTPRSTGIMPSPAEAARIYAATGVWQRVPRFIDTPTGVIPFTFDAPAAVDGYTPPAAPDLTALLTPQPEVVLAQPVNPPPADTVFARDVDGSILATPEGTVTPEGAIVYAGLPDINFNPRPELSQDDLDRMALLAPAPQGVVVIAGPPPAVPPLRPANAQLPALAETDTPPTTQDTPSGEVTSAGSVGLAALELQDSGAVSLDPSVVEDRAADDLRPQLRPQGLVAITAATAPDITDILEGIAAEDATLRFDNSTSLAVRASMRPILRPDNFGAMIAASVPQPPRPSVQETPAPAAPVVAAAPVAPQNFEPVPGGVARAATQEDAISLRDINLIGVYGRQNARRALVRLPNGRYVRVEVGSELDGGEVTAIGDTALNFVKRGRTYAIELPSG